MEQHDDMGATTLSLAALTLVGLVTVEIVGVLAAMEVMAAQEPAEE